MKRNYLRAVFCLIIVFGVLATTGCTDEATYRHLRKYADPIKVIDTHEHQQMYKEPDQPVDIAYLIRSSYLLADIWSSGMIIPQKQIRRGESNDTIWKYYGKYLDFTRNTSYYRQFLRGFTELYGFKDIAFTKENTRALSEQIAVNYKNYPEWFDQAFKKAGYEIMFVHQHWAPYNTNLDGRYFALVFDINGLINQVSHKPPENADKLLFLYKEASDAGFRINSLDDYLKFCDFLFKKNIENKAVCVKNSLAYSRTLLFENVPYAEAKALFEKKSSELTAEEAKKLEDFMFHWVIRKSVEYNLPVQIHTGYLAGNGNVLDNGYPLKLNNLFLQYPNAKFVLFHGGFPWTREYAALGKMFRNVYLDLVWLPQISREEAVNALDVTLDCVPYNKIFWGGDCKYIEESVGSLDYGKDVVAEVLARRVNRGVMTRQVACEIMERIFRINAIEVFDLENKLGIKNEHNPAQN